MDSDEKMHSNITFSLRDKASKVGPRIGLFRVQKSKSHEISLDTPAMLVSTSRGTVPHLTRDHIRRTAASKMILVPFESFLERMPPAPTLLSNSRPLETFLNVESDKHIVAMTLRDPFDNRELPANGNNFVSAVCVRGVRKIAPEQYWSYVEACKPDIAFALCDIPFTSPPFSQRRVTKSLERSQAWLLKLVERLSKEDASRQPSLSTHAFVQMVGDTSELARESFAHLLLEAVEGREAEAIAPFRCLDDGMLGYSFDLSSLRTSLCAPDTTHPLTGPNTPGLSSTVGSLLRASLSPLTVSKPRVATGAASPHEVLLLIRDVGIDIFDVAWAQKAADWGIALDFCFPAPDSSEATLDLGHNLYNERYEIDFSRLSDSFLDRCSAGGVDEDRICSCIACSPVSPEEEIKYADVDQKCGRRTRSSNFDPPHTRAYVHHLLHTHEMSAHTLLASHNLAVAEKFFTSVRRIAKSDLQAQSSKDETRNTELVGGLSFSAEVERFLQTYDIGMRIFVEAKEAWIRVDKARGKGRLSREKETQGEEDLSSHVELSAESPVGSEANVSVQVSLR